MLDDVIRYIDNGGQIRCNSEDERQDVLEFLRSIGYNLGFDEEDVKGKPWFHVLLSGGYIHLNDGPYIPRGKKMAYVYGFDELLGMYNNQEDDDIPDASELPDIGELIGTGDNK